MSDALTRDRRILALRECVLQWVRSACTAMVKRSKKVRYLHLQQIECLQLLKFATQLTAPLRFRGGNNNDQSRAHRRGSKASRVHQG
jgi:hypothetical protein